MYHLDLEDSVSTLWKDDIHAKAGIGCEKCHGGNATTFEPFLAHQNMLNMRNPASPINRFNLPKTCGTCHTGPFDSFQKSQHYKLLLSGDDRGPTCSTCHGGAAGNLLSPKSLEGQCTQCHGEGKPLARPERAANARLMMAEVSAVRVDLKQAQGLIKRVRDKALRAKYDFDDSNQRVKHHRKIAACRKQLQELALSSLKRLLAFMFQCVRKNLADNAQQRTRIVRPHLFGHHRIQAQESH